MLNIASMLPYNNKLHVTEEGRQSVSGKVGDKFNPWGFPGKSQALYAEPIFF